MEGLQEILKQLKENAVEKIEFIDQSISEQEAKQLAEALSQNQTLRCLDLSRTSIKLSALPILVPALASHPKLEELILDEALVEIADKKACIIALTSLFKSSSLKHLSIKENFFGQSAMQYLAGILAKHTNSPLTQLDISGYSQKLDETTIQTFAIALKNNKTLVLEFNVEKLRGGREIDNYIQRNKLLKEDYAEACYLFSKAEESEKEPGKDIILLDQLIEEYGLIKGETRGWRRSEGESYRDFRKKNHPTFHKLKKLQDEIGKNPNSFSLAENLRALAEEELKIASEGGYFHALPPSEQKEIIERLKTESIATESITEEKPKKGLAFLFKGFLAFCASCYNFFKNLANSRNKKKKNEIANSPVSSIEHSDQQTAPQLSTQSIAASLSNSGPSSLIDVDSQPKQKYGSFFVESSKDADDFKTIADSCCRAAYQSYVGNALVSIEDVKDIFQQVLYNAASYLQSQLKQKALKISRFQTVSFQEMAIKGVIDDVEKKLPYDQMKQNLITAMRKIHPGWWIFDIGNDMGIVYNTFLEILQRQKEALDTLPDNQEIAECII